MYTQLIIIVSLLVLAVLLQKFFAPGNHTRKNIVGFALVKYGEYISAMSGSINGTTHSHNRGGAYMRNRSIPTNPSSSFQVAVRNRLTTFSQGWRVLTQAQRTAWNNAVQNFATTNVLGDLRNPTGKNLYTRLNINLAIVGSADIDTPPVPSGVSSPATLSFTIVAATGVMTVTFTPTPVPAGSDWVLDATGAVSAGTNFVKNRFRFLKVFNSGDISPQLTTVEYAARFGAVVAGQKIFISLTAVNNTTGEKGVALEAFAIAT